MMPRLLSEITSNGEAAFPWKLHRVLEEAERLGFSDVVSWQGNRAFKVHDPKNFEKSIMKEYFNQTRYKSFQRQLNIYGFERITIGADIGSYTHQLLVRGKPNICRFMVRTKVKNKGSKASNNNGSSSNNLAQYKPKRSSQAQARATSMRPSTSLSALRTSMALVAQQQAQRRSTIPRSTGCPVGNARSTSVSTSIDVNNAKMHDNDSSRRTSADGAVAPKSIPGKGPTGFRNDIFASSAPFDNDCKLRRLGFHNYSNNFSESRDMKDIKKITTVTMSSQTLPSTIQSMPSTADEDFSKELFASEEFGFLREDKQGDASGLDNNSIRTVSAQASDHIMFQRSHQQLDPFCPDPIQESQPVQQQQHRQMQQEQQRKHECQRLQLQIEQLQNRIVLLNNNQNHNQAPQELPRQPNINNNNSGNSNYLCNGVAAIEPGDRGTINAPFREISPQNTIGNNSNYFDNNKNPLENCTDELCLDPTPINDCQVAVFGCSTNSVRRSISFSSFP